MTSPTDLDPLALQAHQAPTLPFGPGELDRSVFRMRRSDFARFLSVSKQAVGEWVRLGKITVGDDGLIDPRQAVAQLLRNTDAYRLRSRVLGPIVRDLGTLRRRIADLEKALAAAREESAFEAGANAELLAEWRALRCHLAAEREDLAGHDGPQVAQAVDRWMARVEDGEAEPFPTLATCLVLPKGAAGPACAPGEAGEGAGIADLPISIGEHHEGP